MNKTLILVTVLVVLGCSGAGLRQSSAGSQGPGTLCKSDNDCGSRFLVCKPQPDGTLKCVPSNRPVYDRPAIGALPWCHSDAECPPGYFCEKGGHQEGDDTSRGHCSLPTGITE